MKILGHDRLDERYEDVTVGTAGGELIALRVKAPGLAAIDRVTQDIPDPQPPLCKGEHAIQRDDKGNPLRDGFGAVIVARDENDPDYKAKLVEAGRLRTCALLLECLGEQVELDAKREEFDSALGFYQSVDRELAEAGLGIAEKRELGAAVNRLLHLDGPEIAKAREALGSGNE